MSVLSPQNLQRSICLAQTYTTSASCSAASLAPACRAGWPCRAGYVFRRWPSPNPASTTQSLRRRAILSRCNMFARVAPARDVIPGRRTADLLQVRDGLTSPFLSRPPLPTPPPPAHNLHGPRGGAMTGRQESCPSGATTTAGSPTRRSKISRCTSPPDTRGAGPHRACRRRRWAPSRP